MMVGLDQDYIVIIGIDDKNDTKDSTQSHYWLELDPWIEHLSKPAAADYHNYAKAYIRMADT